MATPNSNEEMMGLPGNVDTERFLLGSILLDPEKFKCVKGILSPEDFSLRKHSIIFKRLCGICERGEDPDTAILYNELDKFGEAQACDGVSGIFDLTTGIPVVPNIDGYVRIVLEASRLRKLVFGSQRLMHQALMGEMSSLEIIAAARELLKNVESGGEIDSSSDTVEAIIEAAGGISKFFSATPGIQSPITAINEATGGVGKGDLFVIGARPSMGKTAFALNWLYHAAKNGVPSVLFSCEMSQAAILKRLVSLCTGITFKEIQHSTLNASERRACQEALAHIMELPLRIVSAGGKSVMRIRAHVEQLHRKGACELCLVDYLGLIRGTGQRDANRNRELGQITQELKLLAEELNIGMVALAQLSRSVESRPDKHPVMSDLRDSGEIEEHSDLVAFLYRGDYYDRDNPAIKGMAEFIIAKQRNGDNVVVPMEFKYYCGKFYDAPGGPIA